jgi:hypothetical protein
VTAAEHSDFHGTYITFHRFSCQAHHLDIATKAEPSDLPSAGADVVGLVDFINEFGAGLSQQVRSQNPPV